MWDSCSDAMIAFQNDDLTEDLATIVENDVIQAAINRQVTIIPDRVQVLYETKAKKIKLPQPNTAGNSPWAEVELEDGTILKTRLLVCRTYYHSHCYFTYKNMQGYVKISICHKKCTYLTYVKDWC